MKKRVAQRIARYLESAKRSDLGRSVSRLSLPTPLTGYHHFADGKPVLAAFCLSDRKIPLADLLLIDWYFKDDWYFVIASNSTHAPLLEIRHAAEKNSPPILTWRYKPTKRDGQNSQRRKCFAHYYGDVLVQLPIPAPGKRSRFLDDIADLLETRVRADQLDSSAPINRTQFPEGELVERYHIQRERSSEVVRLAKQHAAALGQLKCQVCNFDFQEKYGEIGVGYIEAHHTKPVSQMKKGEATRVEDIALVCSNCHRMLHRRRPWLQMDQLKDVLC